jgi:hypothetical protein
MPPTAVNNWFGDIVSHPKIIVEAKSTKDGSVAQFVGTCRC